MLDEGCGQAGFSMTATVHHLDKSDFQVFFSDIFAHILSYQPFIKDNYIYDFKKPTSMLREASRLCILPLMCKCLAFRFHFGFKTLLKSIQLTSTDRSTNNGRKTPVMGRRDIIILVKYSCRVFAIMILLSFL